MSRPSTSAESSVKRPDDGADHVARRPGRVFLRQHALQDKADRPATEDGDGDSKGKLFRVHPTAPSPYCRKVAALTAWRGRMQRGTMDGVRSEVMQSSDTVS